MAHGDAQGFGWLHGFGWLQGLQVLQGFGWLQGLLHGLLQGFGWLHGLHGDEQATKPTQPTSAATITSLRSMGMYLLG